MLKHKAYPCLEIDLEKFRMNVKAVKERCDAAGIKVCGIVKGYWADPRLTEIVAGAGFAQMGSSRLSQIDAMKRAGIKGPFMLIRVPMISELHDVAELCDYSLESSVETLQALNDECLLAGRRHKVVLMVDLGDLREGMWDKEMAVAAAVHVEEDLPMLTVAGVATYLGCYGSIKATPQKMADLVDIAQAIEAAIGHPLEMVSGGGSNAYMLVEEGIMPPGLNHLRLGEAYSAPYAVLDNYDLLALTPHIDTEVFTLKAEVVEVERKPSYPQGEFGKCEWGDIEGNKYVDRGIRKRAVLAIGRADCADPLRLRPRLDGIEILGASSDHTILDIEDCSQDIRVGDVLEFGLEYGTMLSLTGARDVVKVYKDIKIYNK